MMHAVVVDPESKARLSVAEVEEPEPGPSEALVRVAAISLNRGEVRRAEAAEPGFRPGWDLAGTVERAATEGPGEGARVVGFLPSGAWGELAAVPANALAQLPDGCRAAFVLHDVQGLEHSEVAKVLGIAEGTSKSQVHKARLRLRALLGRSSG